MSLTEARDRYPVVDLQKRKRSLATPVIPVPEPVKPRPVPQRAAPQPKQKSARPSPLIQPKSIAGRSLIAVIAIMTFLASLTLGVVVLVRTSASDWQAEVSRELTVQIRPADGRDIEADVAAAEALLRNAPGIARARAYSLAESSQLLEPWLGSGVQLSGLPVPRLIVVNAMPDTIVDMAALKARLLTAVPTASLDDHRAFIERMRHMTRLAVLTGTTVLLLMLGATVLLVGFATRGAMASNHQIVEVLHFVGAKNRYIAGQFQRHFLRLGMRGAIIGGGAAMLVFVALRYSSAPLGATTEMELASMFGTLSLGPNGYAGMTGVIILVAAVAGMTSRWTVHRTLKTLD
ncbi:cell division ABC transporter subunit FtsX [Variibacter gotjawalensis]|uniref:Cell division ABC transporter subunit FtsX n=1 Tax=Variibacter gotjawalensis TaxID=1333996 RepID=A0A0S3PPV3_9BRAD|nr:ABC transporter permease [Variibacter gotjawalensis]NIK48284.1 cell division transport system permease protein [Variibacter gotjawalensis]RZS50156.1 cell division transport system permease protein [Variibacter gotjawalensis]BAT57986.1 cell division ABC transporter subunit FtsX [Variibacter gotjawalensis]